MQEEATLMQQVLTTCGNVSLGDLESSSNDIYVHTSEDSFDTPLVTSTPLKSAPSSPIVPPFCSVSTSFQDSDDDDDGQMQQDGCRQPQTALQTQMSEHVHQQLEDAQRDTSTRQHWIGFKIVGDNIDKNVRP